MKLKLEYVVCSFFCDPNNMQTVMSTDSPSERGEIRISIFVGIVIGFLTVGILIGSFLGAGLMKCFNNHKTKEISHQNKRSKKSDTSRSQNEATFYDEIVLTDQSSGINLSQNIAYGEVKKTETL